MELDETIRSRRSIRKYKDKNIPAYIIEELLDLTRYAPSSMDGQPWHFIVVREEGIKKQLAEIKNRYCPAEKQVYQADFLKNANVVVIVCVDKEKSFDREVENGVLTSAYIILGAYSRGIGSVFMTAYRANEPRLAEDISSALNIPQNITPITIIPLGYPAKTPKPKNLRTLDELISYETFGGR